MKAHRLDRTIGAPRRTSGCTRLPIRTVIQGYFRVVITVRDYGIIQRGLGGGWAATLGRFR